MLDGKRCPVCNVSYAYDPYYGEYPPGWRDIGRGHCICGACYEKREAARKEREKPIPGANSPAGNEAYINYEEWCHQLYKAVEDALEAINGGTIKTATEILEKALDF